MNLPPRAISNGLAASDWVASFTAPLPLAQALLVALRAAEIAAYAVPEVDESAFRALSTRSPLDHTIYVDRERRTQAKSIMVNEARDLDHQTSDPAIDQEFAALVEQLKTVDSDDEEHFTPPRPALHISPDPVKRAAWVGVLGGPLLLLTNAWGIFTLDGLAPLIGIAAFAAGFITLVVTMPDRAPIDEGPEDGAVL